jgi:preprotein translocase subunit SecG
MAALSILLLVIFAISAILLLLVVLIQDEQGEGIGGIFGGGGMSGQIGNRKGNFLTRTTTVLGVIFLLSSLGLAWANRSDSGADIEAAARQAERESTATQWWIEPDSSDSGE